MSVIIACGSKSLNNFIQVFFYPQMSVGNIVLQDVDVMRRYRTA